MRRKLLYIIFFVVILLIFTVIFGLYEVKFFTGRAAFTDTPFSKENSYMFVSPLQAKANNQEKIRVTVFVLNGQGLGVMGKKVVVPPDPALKIEEIQAMTDNFGKAFFDIASGRPGEYFLEIRVDGTALDQAAHLVFN